MVAILGSLPRWCGSPERRGRRWRGSGVGGGGAPVVPEDDEDDDGAQRDVADLMARSAMAGAPWDGGGVRTEWYGAAASSCRR